MKREDVLKILENAELGNDAKIDQILNMRGAELSTTNARIKELEDTVAQKAAEYSSLTEKYKDYDTILQERNALTAEKAENAFKARFDSVLGTNKPKNQFTREGLMTAFRTEIEKAENAEKKDVDIFKTLVDGHEGEYFDGTVEIRMAPINPDVTPPTETQSYLNEFYKNNPYYKQS
jgi:hypothetical protein